MGGRFVFVPSHLLEYVSLYTFLVSLLKAFDMMYLMSTGLLKILGDQPCFLVER